jgi:mannose-6-phosphate isomerase-like protein (cupin superfamily)
LFFSFRINYCSVTLREEKCDFSGKYGFFFFQNREPKQIAPKDVHYHSQDEETYYILKGSAKMAIEGKESPVKSGRWKRNLLKC